MPTTEQRQAHAQARLLSNAFRPALAEILSVLGQINNITNPIDLGEKFANIGTQFMLGDAEGEDAAIAASHLALYDVNNLSAGIPAMTAALTAFKAQWDALYPALGVVPPAVYVSPVPPAEPEPEPGGGGG
jgi:hypothetical protein